ncbi:helix-turn-helix transcriptional regulator [Shimia sp. R10_1]|uniref:winged helix-turn-helix transcriptional regulator n=1 Tax=Shimia sp. R10_1 TaxID=2821095 RepID=UPI001ADB55EF|nr:helix-turn-helix domain-containing protein [Shimia sp. R10_1]MBO9474605.1 helix-turn-helix transcriptional regulator [Shimia sp. R10_1]
MTNPVPTPGQPVRGSKTGKPIMALFDLLGRSWALGVLWQLSEGGLTFRALQARCEQVSPTVLNRRLKELMASGLVQRGDAGYELSDTGHALFALLDPLGPWAQAWARGLEDADKD